MVSVGGGFAGEMGLGLRWVPFCSNEVVTCIIPLILGLCKWPPKLSSIFGTPWVLEMYDIIASVFFISKRAKFGQMNDLVETEFIRVLSESPLNEWLSIAT